MKIKLISDYMQSHICVIVLQQRFYKCKTKPVTPRNKLQANDAYEVVKKLMENLLLYILWDITPVDRWRSTDVSEKYIVSIFTGLHGVISQKIYLFKVTTLSTTCPTYHSKLEFHFLMACSVRCSWRFQTEALRTAVLDRVINGTH
jgi:hypothetical protein